MPLKDLDIQNLQGVVVWEALSEGFNSWRMHAWPQAEGGSLRALSQLVLDRS